MQSDPKCTAKKKQSIPDQRQQREKKGVVGAETDAGASSIPVSQISHEKAAISRGDWLKNECDFRNMNSWEVESCCYYEYFRESAAMRKTRVLPTCTDLVARSTLTFVLINAGWMDAAERDEAPPPWNSLDEGTKENVSHCVRRWRKSYDPRTHPVWLAREFSPWHDAREAETQLEKWKEDACYYVSSERNYFFGLFRLDESYNATEAVEAFGEWLAKRIGKRKKGNLQFYGKLLQLAAMRVRHHYRRAERREILIKMTGKKTYKRGINEREPDTGKMDVGLSRDCREARKFFQTLFPGEQPISFSPRR
jgi:hypothetical protein